MSSNEVLRTRLHGLAREALDQTPDYAEAARIVFQRLTPDEHADVAEMLLPAFVSGVSARQRPRVDISPENDGFERSEAEQPPSRPHRANSVHESRIKAWLRTSYGQPDGTERKFLGAMTVSDLVDAARIRYDLAVTNRRSAEQLEALAVAVKEADVKTVGDLPYETLVRLLVEQQQDG